MGKSVSCFCLLGLMAFFASNTSYATLGQGVDSIDHDAQMFGGNHQVLAASQKGFAIHEIDMQNRTVKEYVTPSGAIFGVTWRGGTPPDLSVLFGSYFTEYQAAAQQTPRRHGRGLLVVKSAHMVVQMSGHMRDVRGKAYVPQLLPSGVTVQDLK